MSDYQAEIKNDSTRPEGVFSRVGDATRMLKFYRPQISLGEGIKRTIDYLSKINYEPGRV